MPWHAAWSAPAVVAIICLIASAYLYFPGFMSGDSFTQYRQMKGIEGLSNIHPAALVYVWRAIDHVIPGPGGLFLFHLAVYWAAVVVFAIAMWRRPMARGVGVLLLGLFPPTFMVSLHIWKDASMVGCSLLAVALLTRHVRTPRTWLLVAAGVLLFYAVAVRHNAIVGLVPVLLFLSIRLGERIGVRSMVTKLAICAALATTMFGTARAINAYDARVVHMSGLLMIWDLSAMSVYDNQLLVPRVLFRDESRTDDELLGRLKRYFTSDYCHPVFIHVLNGFVSNSDLPRLFRFWRSMVEDHPTTYFRHRRIVAQRLLGLGMPLCQQYHLPGIDRNDFGFKFARGDTLVFTSMWKLMAWLRSTIVYRPWPYLAAAILAALWIVIRRRSIGDDPDVVLALMLVVSAVVYASTLFLIAPGTEYRYIVWAVAASVWSLVLMFPALFRPMSGDDRRMSTQTS